MVFANDSRLEFEITSFGRFGFGGMQYAENGLGRTSIDCDNGVALLLMLLLFLLLLFLLFIVHPGATYHDIYQKKALDSSGEKITRST